MQQVMIFMSYRTGSKTLLNMLGAAVRDISDKEDKFRKIFRGSFLATTQPKDTCPVIYRRDGADIIQIQNQLKDDFSNIIYWTRFENEIPSLFSLPNLSKLNGDLKFITIIRDGRNQIESWMNFRGQKKPKSVEGDKPFIDMCEGWVKRAKHTKLLIENFNCKLVKFEDLIIDPKLCFYDIMSFIGLEPDNLYLDSISDILNSEKTDDKIKWKNWNEWKLNTFYSIAEDEMKYFNYM